MDRRHSFKLMLAAAIAPAFVAKGLMKVKPIVVPDLTGKAIQIMQTGTTFVDLHPMVINPDMYEQLKQAQADIDEIAGVFAIPDQYLGMDWIVHTKRITVQEALAQYPDNKRLTLMIAGNQAGNHNGYIKPEWDNG